jgi:predicted enzyme related to lactoylglutathione lyase
VANHVNHFEITGKDGKKLQQFYGQLFDWKVDANNPMDYGMVQLEGGVSGGIGGTPDGTNGIVTVYVAVDDAQKYLDKAVSMGGSVVMPVTEIPGYVTIAQFADPEGHVIGLSQGM